MVYQLIILIAIPIILGISVISPFEPPEMEEEQIQETPIGETPTTSWDIFYIFLAIIWFFFLIRILKVRFARRHRSSIVNDK